ncbi:LysM domain-containing protein [Roseimicrobium gellanilyticum]|uniref:LysM domain-containing protein n=1 Tax=Roseimicrobium gellanilyticum TaxID=748857 RepID=A0A366HXM7_9BACT|nr:LysM peptidoglycan-binding domain-containing protein [Roseimicrobium gellanilyticum]RBP48078.1 LysM domain-containing protein [Roseimicrobium gellanilyticum]
MKPKTTPKNPEDFNSDKFWRHYVATDATDADMLEDEKKTGNASRIFIFLLLLHAFFIGAVVLYNLVAERPKPAFVDGTAPSKKAGDTQSSPIPSVQGKTTEYTVATGDSLKTIADKTGASQDEIVLLNGLDRGNSIAVGKKLLVPDRAPPKAKEVAPPQVPQPGPPPQEVVVAVQHTTKPGVMETFRAVEPQKTESKAGSTAKMAIQDSPPEKVEAVAQHRPMKVEDKLPEEPKPVKKNVEDSLPEAKPAPAKPAEPKPVAKVAETKKTPAPEPAVAKPAAAKPAEAKPAVAKPAEAKPAAAKPAAAKPSNAATHTVKSGETPYAIARKYGVTPDQIMRYNGIKDASKLKIGTVLKVPPKQ